MNVLAKEKQIAAIAALAEGNGIRSIERMTGVHRDTIMRLAIRVGQSCARIMDERMRGLDCTHVEVDEIWGFINKKKKNLRPTDPDEYGDVWTFISLDSDTKLVPSFRVGKRDVFTAYAFIDDLADCWDDDGDIIDSQDDVGGYPAYATGSAPTDTDSDGMPDTWEDANGTNKNTADNNGDLDSDGYTNLEEYLNSLCD